MSNSSPVQKQCTICEKFHFAADDSEECICSSCYEGFTKFNSIMTLKRAILYLKCTSHHNFGDNIVHGVDCAKVEHVGKHVHDKDDDTPFDIGSQTFCGRCHFKIRT